MPLKVLPPSLAATVSVERFSARHHARGASSASAHRPSAGGWRTRRASLLIKPDNILLAGGSAGVTDFGVAKAIIDSRNPTHIRAGTTIAAIGVSLGAPRYMAPEQAAADPSADHRADIYALGIVAYEMLAGVPPFHGRGPHELLAPRDRPRRQSRRSRACALH